MSICGVVCPSRRFRRQAALEKARGHLMVHVDRAHEWQVEFGAFQAKQREAAKGAATAYIVLWGQTPVADGGGHDPAAVFRGQLAAL
eukprot:2052451-Pyramimonas_sp.AAC.1